MQSRLNRLFYALIVFFWLLPGLLYLPGCRAFPLRPRVPPERLSRGEVVDRIYERTHFFSTMTDTRITLRAVHEDVDGRHSFPPAGGVLAFDRMLPGLWLRAEKFGQNIFTLRAHGDDFWLELPDSREVVTGGRAAYRRMPHLVRPGEILLWLAPPDWLGLNLDSTAMTVTGGEYVFEVSLNGFPLRRVSVDGYDFHVNSIATYDILGQVDTLVVMDRHRRLNGAVFPHRFTVSRPHAGYEVSLQLGRPEFDRPLPERTFQPRSRPGWKHIDLDGEPQGGSASGGW